MAIRDLLWACPVCGTFAAIRDSGRTEQCAACHTTFTRGKGATIELRLEDGSTEISSPARLVDRLPPVSAMSLPDGRLGPARTLVRVARSTTPVKNGDDFLGNVELFGPAVEGTVTLDSRTLATGIPENPIVWPLESITAVQPSSSTVQINSLVHPLTSFRFLEQSARLWEEAIQWRIRAVHEAAGRGTVIQFHPHIRFA
jgi:hypothetical protein